MAKRKVIAKKTFCNKCGKPFDMWDEVSGFEAESVLGFGSKYDGLRLELDLCCKCMDTLIEECKISPLVEEESFSEDE